jgi:hypothetical protein
MSEMTEEWKLIQEVHGCPDCRVWDPENQPSVLRQLEQDPHSYDDKVIVSLLTNDYAYSMRLHRDYLLCANHAEKAPSHWRE